MSRALQPSMLITHTHTHSLTHTLTHTHTHTPLINSRCRFFPSRFYKAVFFLSSTKDRLMDFFLKRPSGRERERNTDVRKKH